jgi:large subunit ribosomal protein L7/L12
MSSKLIEEIKKMSVMELNDLVKEIEEAFGVSAAAPVAAVAAAPAASAGQAAETKTEFKVTIKDAGSEKIKVIKALRTITTLALGDAKKAVDSVPFVVAEAAPKEEAEKMKKALEESGAKVELS